MGEEKVKVTPYTKSAREMSESQRRIEEQQREYWERLVKEQSVHPRS